jgi:dephospho-CoA kinase
MTGRLRGQLRKIAITGGIGSGKSTLVRELAALGYPVFDADILVAQVVTQPETQKQITNLLGPDCYVTDDQGHSVYQRSWVRERVFADAQARKDLEAIIHPAIFKKFTLICDQIHKLSLIHI